MVSSARRFTGLYTLAEIRERNRRRKKHGGAAQADTGPTTILYDSFNRADGPIGTADIGGAWTDPSGFWTVDSGNAKLSGASGFRVCYLFGGDDEGDFYVTMTNVNTHGLMFRRDGATGNFTATRVSGGLIRLIRVTAGVATTIGTGGAVVAGDEIRVNIWGNTYTVYINGVQQFQVTETQGDDRHNHGLMSQVTAGRLDEFRMDTAEQAS